MEREGEKTQQHGSLDQEEELSKWRERERENNKKQQKAVAARRRNGVCGERWTGGEWVQGWEEEKPERGGGVPWQWSCALHTPDAPNTLASPGCGRIHVVAAHSGTCITILVTYPDNNL